MQRIDPSSGYHSRMRTLLAVVALLGCERTRTTDLDSPVAAAQCEARAIRAKNVDALLGCMHPLVRESAKGEIAGHAPDWTKFETQLPRLEQASATDFVTQPVPSDHGNYGDQMASLRLDRDSLQVVHTKDGRWYIVDTGL